MRCCIVVLSGNALGSFQFLFIILVRLAGAAISRVCESGASRLGCGRRRRLSSSWPAAVMANPQPSAISMCSATAACFRLQISCSFKTCCASPWQSSMVLFGGTGSRSVCAVTAAGCRGNHAACPRTAPEPQTAAGIHWRFLASLSSKCGPSWLRAAGPDEFWARLTGARPMTGKTPEKYNCLPCSFPIQETGEPSCGGPIEVRGKGAVPPPLRRARRLL